MAPNRLYNEEKWQDLLTPGILEQLDDINEGAGEKLTQQEVLCYCVEQDQPAAVTRPELQTTIEDDVGEISEVTVRNRLTELVEKELLHVNTEPNTHTYELTQDLQETPSDSSEPEDTEANTNNDDPTQEPQKPLSDSSPSASKSTPPCEASTENSLQAHIRQLIAPHKPGVSVPLMDIALLIPLFWVCTLQTPIYQPISTTEVITTLGAVIVTYAAASRLAANRSSLPLCRG